MSNNVKIAQPKRPLSSYVIYSNEIRPKVKEENPEMAGKDVMRTISEMWKGLDENLKQQYVEKSKLDKERYEKECNDLGIPLKAGRSKKA